VASARERLPELDAMRGIAAFVVRLYHSLITLQTENSTLRRISFTPPTYPIFAGRLAVIFFFVLSGMVLTRALMGRTQRGAISAPLSFACQRVVRLCLPAAAALTVSAILYWLLWHGPWPGSALADGWRLPPEPIGFLAQTFFGGADGDFYLNPALWSLVHEFRLSLLVLLPEFRGPRGSFTLVLFGAFA
jgi:peptidoglycan/LPS O-acetylase OafA/YrhL